MVAAARRRFRPVLPTALTPFVGLVPMIFETSTQARFLVPMVIALGFGVLLSTPAVLLLTPTCRILDEDLRRWWRDRGVARRGEDRSAARA